MTSAILCVFGTRPELLKLAPVVTALRGRGAEVVPLATGQHADLLDAAALARIGQVANLGVPSTTLLRFLTGARRKLHDLLARTNPKPGVVLVQGDTASAFVGALVAEALGIPIAHVEAGVRSGDAHDPWPEEMIRVEIDKLARWHYAPTMHAAQNLVREGHGLALVTGNTSVDALRLAGAEPSPELAPPTILMTLHRREFYRRPDALGVLQAICDATDELRARVIWPVHPAMVELVAKLRIPFSMTVRPPVPHAAMLAMLAGARGVLTDSGGLVEEAATLGVPTAVLRNATDRPEAEDVGNARRFAPTPEGARDALGMLQGCALARVPSACFGDGFAADRIAAHLMQVLG